MPRDQRFEQSSIGRYVKAAKVEELVDKDVRAHGIAQGYEPEEPSDLPEALVDGVEMVEVFDPIAGEKTLTRKTDSSFYDAGGRRFQGKEICGFIQAARHPSVLVESSFKS